ncbi:Xaa-Pro aminopeptidase, partial [Burkholderia multivorans]
GLWAVEPHLGFAGVGAKFEELLVITEDDAYWLDDGLPHVRRWQRRLAERAQTVATVSAAA